MGDDLEAKCIRLLEEIENEEKHLKETTEDINADPSLKKSHLPDVEEVMHPPKCQQDLRIKEWEDENAVHVETKASLFVKINVETHSFVTVTGEAGSGKSAIIHNVALELQVEGFEIFPVESPEEIYKYLQLDKKQVFILDDPIGKYTIDRKKFKSWLDFNTDSPLSVQTTKVLCSLGRKIINESDFKANSSVLSENVVDIQGDGLTLSPDEKVKMIERHLERKKRRFGITAKAKTVSEIEEEVFPLRSGVFTPEKEFNFYKIQDWEYFKTPFILYQGDIQRGKLHHKVKLCILLLGLAIVNRSSVEAFQLRKNRSRQGDETEAFNLACEITPRALISGFEDVYESLLHLYQRQRSRILSFNPDFIYDVISFQFGQNSPQFIIQNFSSEFLCKRVCVSEKVGSDDDPYLIPLAPIYFNDMIERLVGDLERRHYRYVIMNKCWDDERFMDAFAKYFESKLERKVSFWEKLTMKRTLIDLLTEQQSSKEDIFCELDKIKETGVANTWTWYYLAMNLLASQGITLLHWIAVFGHRLLFIYVWEKLTAIQRIKVQKKVPLLHCASLGGDKEMCKIVLEVERDKINTPILQSKQHPLHYAARNKIDVVQMLLDLGVDINVKDGVGGTPLFYAAGHDNPEMVKFLLHYGDGGIGSCTKCSFIGKSNPDAQHSYSKTASSLNQNADPNMCTYDGCSPLYMAAANNCTETTKVLLDHDTDMRTCTNDGVGPLHMAAQYNSADTAKILLDHGADSNVCRKDGITPLYLAARYNSIDMAKLLLDYKADPNHRANEGACPLHIASKYNFTDIIKVLLDYKAEPNLCAANGCTSLHIAATHNYVNTAILLLDHNADPNLCANNGSSPLHSAAQNNSVETAKLLLDHHADPNRLMKEGTSPLHSAARYNCTDTAKLLIDYGANPVMKYQGLTPLEIVKRFHPESTELIKLLTRSQSVES